MPIVSANNAIGQQSVNKELDPISETDKIK